MGPPIPLFWTSHDICPSMGGVHERLNSLSSLRYTVRCGHLVANLVFFSMFNRTENPQIDNIENPHFCTFLPAQDGLARFTSECNTCQTLGSKHGSPFTNSGFISAIHGKQASFPHTFSSSGFKSAIHGSRASYPHTFSSSGFKSAIHGSRASYPHALTY